MKAGEVGVGALRDIEHLGTAEAGHLRDRILFIKSRISELPEALAFEGGYRRNLRWQSIALLFSKISAISFVFFGFRKRFSFSCSTSSISFCIAGLC